MKQYKKSSSPIRRAARTHESHPDPYALSMIPPVLQLTSAEPNQEDGNIEVDRLLEELTAEMRTEKEQAESFVGPAPARGRELIKAPFPQTGNSGRELIKEMLRMKDEGYKYVWIKGLNKKKERGEKLTPREEKLLKLNPKGKPGRRIKFSNFGGKAIRKPKGLGGEGENALTTNCSTAVQEALFGFLGGYGGSVDGVALTDPKFRNRKSRKTKNEKVIPGRNFQDGTWINYLEQSGLGYQVHDIHSGLMPGDILSSGSHRVLFLGYTGEKVKNKKGRVIRSEIRIIEANVTGGKQGFDAIKTGRKIWINKRKHKAGRLFDYKED